MHHIIVIGIWKLTPEDLKISIYNVMKEIKNIIYIKMVNSKADLQVFKYSLIIIKYILSLFSL